MNIMVFDTETTSLTKPFCYNIGYVIYDTEADTIKVAKDFVVEQVWHNEALFCSAYYANKRPLYVGRMKAKKTIMKKFGYITQEMCRDIENYNVSSAYAYNSPFDDKVFQFNCDWFKCINPFDNIPIFDIRGYVHNKIAFTVNFKAFCDNYEYYTEAGNYSTTAETLFRYITGNTDFEEEHTALSDSKIECKILKYCIDNGANYETEYKVYNSIPREHTTEVIIRNESKENIAVYQAKKKTITKTSTIYTV